MRMMMIINSKIPPANEQWTNEQNDEHRWLHITDQMAMRKKWLVLLPFKDRDLNQLEESFKKVIKVNNFPHTSLLHRVRLRLVTLISPLVSILDGHAISFIYLTIFYTTLFSSQVN